MITHVVAKTVLFDSRKRLLILVRSDDDVHRPGGLDLPGGKIDDGEDYKTGAVREAYEEAGLVVRPEDLELFYSTTSHGYNTSAGDYINLVRLLFIAQVADNTIVLSHEHKAYRWVTLDQAINIADYDRYRDLFEYIRDQKIKPEYWSE